MSEHVNSKMEDLTPDQRAYIKAHVADPTQRVQFFSAVMIGALLEGSEAVSHSPEASARRTAAINMAHQLDIMQPPCDGQAEDEMSVYLMDTPKQVEARDEWWSRHDGIETSGDILMVDRHVESGLVCAMFGYEDPEMQSIYNHLSELHISHVGRTGEAETWCDEDWDREGQSDSSGHPLKLSTIHAKLTKMSSNTVFLGAVSHDDQAGRAPLMLPRSSFEGAHHKMSVNGEGDMGYQYKSYEKDVVSRSGLNAYLTVDYAPFLIRQRPTQCHVTARF